MGDLPDVQRGRDGDDDQGRSLLPSAKSVGLFVAVVGLIGVLAAFALGYIQVRNWFFWLAVSLGFLVGLGGIPGLVFLLGPSLPLGTRTVTARILWTIGSLCFGGVIQNRRADGRVTAHVYDSDRHQAYIDGEWTDIEGPESFLVRLGKVPYGVVFEDGDDTYHALVGEPDDEDTVYTGPATATDGGNMAESSILPPVGDRVYVSAHRLYTMMQNVGGPAVVNAMKNRTLKKEGGEGTISQKWMAIGGIMALFFGAMMGLLVVMVG